MRSVVPIRGGSNQSTMSKYYPITRLRKLLTFNLPFMRTDCELLRNSRFSTFNPKSNNKRSQLTISTYVRRLCKLLANCEFALHCVRNSRFPTFNQNSSKKETTTHDRPWELLVNCEFALPRGSDSFRSSEPKQLMHAMWNDTCTIKHPPNPH